MNDKGYIEIQITQNDYCTLNFADGISMKLNIGDKIVIEDDSFKKESDKSILWDEESQRIIRTHPNRWFQSSNKCCILINEKLFHDNYIELRGIVIQPDGKFYSKPEKCLEKEDFPPENMKELYAELNEEARKAKYIKYSPDKLVRGQFGKFGKLGSAYPIEYVLLSDRMLDREPLEGYAYLLKETALSCSAFWRETGERNESYKVLEMEDIDEAKALERYNKFLSVWKE